MLTVYRMLYYINRPCALTLIDMMKGDIARAVLGVGVCFCTATVCLYYVAVSLSSVIEDGPSLSFPRNIDDLRTLASQLRSLKDEHFNHVLLLFVCTYLYKQTFSIPGSLFMNILGGALFGVWVGLPLVCLLTACGATFCYLLSRTFGRTLVLHWFAGRLGQLQDKLNDDQHSLLFVLISLRLFPMSPNWLLNMVSPILGVPLHLFFLSVLIGLVPYNLLCVQAGLVLSELQVLSVLNLKSTLILLGSAFSLVATAVIVRWCKNKNKVPVKHS